MIVVIVRNLIFIVDIHRTLWNNLIWLVLNMELKDQLNRKIKLEKRPQRIISLVPSQTELLFDLGLSNNVVGITNFCIHPEGIRKSKKVVGGTKNIHLDRIISLSPDIILCNKEENTKEMVERLAQDFVVHVSDVNTLEDNFEMIEQYGKMFGVEEIANEIIQKTSEEKDEFLKYVKNRPILKVAYFIWRNPWMVVGGNTFIDYMLQLNKFENVYSDFNRYPEVELENLKQADFYLFSSEPFPFQEKHINEFSEFVDNANFRLVDGEFFSWYGSRLTKAFKYFRELREGMYKS